MISIIIPCYNQARFLKDSAGSALAQGEEVEVIVVDDGSPDDVPGGLGPFADRVRYIRQENAGPNAARNRGAAEARGEWLLFLDADDWLLPGCLAAAGRWAAVVPVPDVVFFAKRFVGADGAPMERRFHPEIERDPFHVLLRENRLSMGTAIVGRDAFRAAGGFDANIEWCEDWDFWLKLAGAGRRFVACEGAETAIRCHHGSRSKSTSAMWFGLCRVLDKHGRTHGRCAECRRAIRECRDAFRGWYLLEPITLDVLRAASARGLSPALALAWRAACSDRRAFFPVCSRLGRAAVAVLANKLRARPKSVIPDLPHPR